MLLFSLTAFLAAQAAQHFPAPRKPTTALRNCRQGECQWLQIRSIERVRAGRDEILRKVTSRAGSSTYSVYKSPPPFSPRLRIDWQKEPRTDYVLCSKRRPATAFLSDGEWVVTQLNLSDLGGYQVAAANLYMQACHNLAPGRWSERRTPRMGYGKTPSGQERYASLTQMLRALD